MPPGPVVSPRAFRLLARFSWQKFLWCERGAHSQTPKRLWTRFSSWSSLVATSGMTAQRNVQPAWVDGDQAQRMRAERTAATTPPDCNWAGVRLHRGFRQSLGSGSCLRSQRRRCRIPRCCTAPGKQTLPVVWRRDYIGSKKAKMTEPWLSIEPPGADQLAANKRSTMVL